jgi:hypothetical protein
MDFKKIDRTHRRKKYCRSIVRLDNKSTKGKLLQKPWQTTTVPIGLYIDSARILNFLGNDHITLS